MEALLKACTSQMSGGTVSDLGALRLAASLSPLLRHSFLDDLAVSLKAFLTPGQVGFTVDSVLRYLREQLEVVEASARSGDDSGKPQRKRRKTEGTSPSPGSDELSRASVAISLMSKIASIVLLSLPARYMQDDTQRAVTEAVQDFYALTRSKLKDILKKIQRDTNGSTVPLQWVAAAILQLQYTVRSSTTLHISTQGDEKISSKLLSTLESASPTAELRVGMVGVLISAAPILLKGSFLVLAACAPEQR